MSRVPQNATPDKSQPATTKHPSMHAPWQYLDEHHPNVTVHLVPLADRWGETVWDGPAIRINLALDLSEIQRRCVLAHELMHVKAGAPCQNLCPDNEAKVIEQTAAWLLPDIAELARALNDCDVDTAATNLLVTRKVLLDRLEWLSDDEMAEMAEMMDTPDPHSLAAAHPTDKVSLNPNRRRQAPRRVLHDCRTSGRGRYCQTPGT